MGDIAPFIEENLDRIICSTVIIVFYVVQLQQIQNKFFPKF